MTEIRDFEFTLGRRKWALPSRRWVGSVRRGPQSTALHGRTGEELAIKAEAITRAWFGREDSLRLWSGIVEAFAQREAEASAGDSWSLTVPR